MEIYPHSAKTFIREARDALERIKNGKDMDDLQRALLSFLNAAKHSIHQLKVDFKNLPGFEEWYAPQKNFLKNDKICIYFWKLRNEVTKAGKKIIVANGITFSNTSGHDIHIPGPVILGPSVGVLVKTPKGNAYEWTPRKDIVSKTTWKFSDYPEGYSETSDPIELCEKYLQSLDTIIDSFIGVFGGS